MKILHIIEKNNKNFFYIKVQLIPLYKIPLYKFHYIKIRHVKTLRFYNANAKYNISCISRIL